LTSFEASNIFEAVVKVGFSLKSQTPIDQIGDAIFNAREQRHMQQKTAAIFALWICV